MQCKVLECPVSCLDLLPCRFYFFELINTVLRTHMFMLDNDVQQALVQEFGRQRGNSLHTGYTFFNINGTLVWMLVAFYLLQYLYPYMSAYGCQLCVPHIIQLFELQTKQEWWRKQHWEDLFLTCTFIRGVKRKCCWASESCSIMQWPEFYWALLIPSHVGYGFNSKLCHWDLLFI
jgi:hypothetical protein